MYHLAYEFWGRGDYEALIAVPTKIDTETEKNNHRKRMRKSLKDRQKDGEKHGLRGISRDRKTGTEKD